MCESYLLSQAYYKQKKILCCSHGDFFVRKLAFYGCKTCLRKLEYYFGQFWYIGCMQSMYKIILQACGHKTIDIFCLEDATMHILLFCSLFSLIKLSVIPPTHSHRSKLSKIFLSKHGGLKVSKLETLGFLLQSFHKWTTFNGPPLKPEIPEDLQNHDCQNRHMGSNMLVHILMSRILRVNTISKFKSQHVSSFLRFFFFLINSSFLRWRLVKDASSLFFTNFLEKKKI